MLDGDDLVEEWSSWYPGFRAFQVEVDDIDDDLIDEIVVGTEEGYVYALNGETKEEEWRSDLLTPLYYPDASLRSLVIIDIDDDFCKEIIVGMTTGIWDTPQLVASTTSKPFPNALSLSGTPKKSATGRNAR